MTWQLSHEWQSNQFCQACNKCKLNRCCSIIIVSFSPWLEKVGLFFHVCLEKEQKWHKRSSALIYSSSNYSLTIHLNGWSKSNEWCPTNGPFYVGWFATATTKLFYRKWHSNCCGKQGTVSAGFQQNNSHYCLWAMCCWRLLELHFIQPSCTFVWNAGMKLHTYTLNNGCKWIVHHNLCSALVFL